MASSSCEADMDIGIATMHLKDSEDVGVVIEKDAIMLALCDLHFCLLGRFLTDSE
uniref:Uncharacterized protein n=1 Tax=Manihot esculenta TaxID=3983 RepID=A0A2C9WGJ1_MANES